MENVVVTNQSDVESLANIYCAQMHNSEYHCKGYEEHHQNGTVHHNSPGTGWEQSHNNSYFADHK